MKYKKKLNINFNNWDDYNDWDNNDIGYYKYSNQCYFVTNIYNNNCILFNNYKYGYYNLLKKLNDNDIKDLINDKIDIVIFDNDYYTKYKYSDILKSKYDILKIY